jgi:hypothetical protein
VKRFRTAEKDLRFLKTYNWLDEMIKGRETRRTNITSTATSNGIQSNEEGAAQSDSL